MSGVLIDLDVMPRGDSKPAPPVPYRLVLALLCAVLLLALGGASARAAPEPPVIVPAELGDAVRVAGDRLLVISQGAAAGQRTIRTYALPDVTPVAEHTVRVPGAVLNVQVAGDLLLITVQDQQTVTFGTVTLRAGRPEPLWRRSALLQGVSTADDLALVREDTAEFGAADWHGVDLHTGAVRWTVHQGEDDDVAVSSYGEGYPKWLYVLTAGGRLEAYDTRTGSMAASRAVPGRFLWSAGDLVMVGAGAAGTTGFDMAAGLRPSWHTGLNLSRYRGPSTCGELLCAYLPGSGVLVLDPRTGRQLWSSDRWNHADRIGRHLLTSTPDAAYPRLHVLDPASGTVLGEAGLWQSAGPGPAPGTAYVQRPDYGRDRIWFGVLDLDRLRVSVLGSADRVGGDCDFGAGALVCRLIDATVGVWRVR